MEETVKQEQTAEQPERTFSQAEVDAIIGDRLKREREKFADYADLQKKATAYDEMVKTSGEAQKEAETLKAQLAEMQKTISKRDARDKVAAETGVPANLLTADTEEELQKQAAAILAFRGQVPKYPNVPDGGETPKPTDGSTRQQFAAWFENNIKK